MKLKKTLTLVLVFIILATMACVIVSCAPHKNAEWSAEIRERMKNAQFFPPIENLVKEQDKKFDGVSLNIETEGYNAIFEGRGGSSVDVADLQEQYTTIIPEITVFDEWVDFRQNHSLREERLPNGNWVDLSEHFCLSYDEITGNISLVFGYDSLRFARIDFYYEDDADVVEFQEYYYDGLSVKPFAFNYFKNVKNRSFTKYSIQFNGYDEPTYVLYQHLNYKDIDNIAFIESEQYPSGAKDLMPTSGTLEFYNKTNGAVSAFCSSYYFAKDIEKSNNNRDSLPSGIDIMSFMYKCQFRDIYSFGGDLLSGYVQLSNRYSVYVKDGGFSDKSDYWYGNLQLGLSCNNELEDDRLGMASSMNTQINSLTETLNISDKTKKYFNRYTEQILSEDNYYFEDNLFKSFCQVTDEIIARARDAKLKIPFPDSDAKLREI